MDFLPQIKDRFRNGSVLVRLLMVNAGIFVLYTLADIILVLFFSRHTLTADNIFMFQWNRTDLLCRPWTIVSSPFTSWGLWHLLFNLLTLYWFGDIFLKHNTSSRLRGLYILGALAAMATISLLSCIPSLANKEWPDSIPLASASVLSISVALAFQLPNAFEVIPILGNVRIKWLVLALGIADIATLPHATAASDLAHLAAAATGWLFVRMLKKGTDITQPVSRFLSEVSLLISKITKNRA